MAFLYSIQKCWHFVCFVQKCRAQCRDSVLFVSVKQKCNLSHIFYSEMLAKFTEDEYLEGKIYSCEKCNSSKYATVQSLYNTPCDNIDITWFAYNTVHCYGLQI